MTIKNKLRVNLSLTVLLIFVITAGEYIQYRLVHKHQEQFKTSIHFAEIAYDLNFLTYDYLQNRSERSEEQWLLQHKKLLNDIEEFAKTETEKSVYLTTAIKNATTSKKIFQKISLIDQNPSFQDNPQLKYELEKRLSAQLLVSSRGLYANALKFVKLNEETELKNQKTESLVIYVIFLFFSCLLASITYLIVHSISPSLSRLKKVFESVGQGNLTTRCHIENRDEFGDISKNFDQMLASLTDITVSRDNLSAEIVERKKIEAQLTQFKLILDKTLDSVFMFAPDTFKFFYVNQGATNQVGYTEEELLEMTSLDIKPNISVEEFQQLITTLLAGNDLSKTFETIHRHKNGTLIPVEIFLQHVTLQDDKDCFVAIVRDITARLKIEKELRQAHKMEAIGTLAGGIAHDFNNILGAIIGFSELAKEDIPAGNKAIKDIDQVIQSGRRAADLVQQILTFSRKSDHRLEPITPHFIIKEVLKMLRSSFPVTIDIQEDIDKECGQILADQTNLHQIIVNLCTNSLHAMENEKGILKVSLQRKEISAEEILGEVGVSPGPFIVLEVSDTGQGMEQETLSRVFEPYYTTKEVGKGTGLGLAVIHGIIHDYHGFIRVQSELGKGTTFYVYIPALQQETLTTIETQTTESLPTGTERIMVVDDEIMLVNLTTVTLERLGYTVTATTQSLEALEKIRNDPDQYDMIITDQTMPNLTGSELAQEILKIKPDMPIILCTGYSSVLSEEDTLAIGIKKYVRKPVDRTILAKTIREVLDEN